MPSRRMSPVSSLNTHFVMGVLLLIAAPFLIWLGCDTNGDFEPLTRAWIARPTDSVCIQDGDQVDFAGGTLGGTDATYSWDFGDPAIPGSTKHNPDPVTYNNVGSFDAVFIATEPSTSESFSDTLHVAVKERLGFTMQPPDDVTADLGASVAYEAVVFGGTAPYSIEWDFDGEAPPSTIWDPSVTYNNGGHIYDDGHGNRRERLYRNTTEDNYHFQHARSNRVRLRWTARAGP